MNTPLPPPPDSPEILFDGIPETPDDSLESVIAGQSPEVKAEVVQIARKEGIPDNDPLWTIINAVRAGDEKYTRCCAQIEAALLEGPTKIREACSNLTLAVHDNATAIAEVQATTADARAVIDEIRSITKSASTYTEKMARWTFGVAVFAALMSAWLAFLVAQNIGINAQTSQNRAEWVGRVETVTKLQKIAGARLQLMGEQGAFDAEWRKLQKAAETAGGVTPELQDRKAKLEGVHADLQARQAKLFKLEDAAYEK